MDATYISANSFSVVEDKTDELLENRRVKLDCGSDGIKYASIVSAIFTSLTTVVINEVVLTSNLTDVLYSVIKTGTQGNLADHFHTTVEGDGGYISDVQSFLDLNDTPSTYSGTEGLYAQSTGSGTIWSPVTSSGSVWLYGEGVPTTQGNIGDFYIDNESSTKDYYTKFSESGLSGLLDLSTKTHFSDNAFGSPSNMSDDNLTTYCQSMTYISVDLGTLNSAVIGKFQVAVHNSTANTAFTDAAPDFQGSNDSTDGSDGDWTSLITIDADTHGVPVSYPGFGNEILINNVHSYRWYRIVGLTATSSTVLNEWRFWYADVTGWTLVDSLNNDSYAFTDLSDTPSTYSGTEGLYAQSTGSGTVWNTINDANYTYTGIGEPEESHSSSLNDLYIDTNANYIYERTSISGTLPIVTAKSVVVDIVDGYSTSYIGIRSIEFYLEEELIAVTSINATGYATTNFASCLPIDAFDTTLSKTGARTDGWFSSSVGGSEQRLICVFDSEIIFDKLVINNYHDNGGSPAFGAEIINIYISTDEIVSTVYNENISNSQCIFNDQIDMHTAVDEIDDQNLELIVELFNWTKVLETKSNFIDLDDTPTTYSGGQYLRTTTSGIELIDGVIITAPNSSEWVIQITNSGTLYTTQI